MASPFRVFRKNVKPMLAFFVVMLMLSWVVGDSLFTYFAGNRNPRAASRENARAVAVSWDGGKLTNLEISNLVARRQILNMFLEQVEGSGAQSAMQAGVEPRPLRVQRMLGPATAQQGVEKSVVNTRLFADRARAAGMRISDEAIVQYLDELGRGNVTRNQMREIASRLGGGRVTIDDIIATLREEMLARNLLSSSQYAFETVTPEQRWLDWLRVNDRVIIEAAAVPTENYLSDVKAPTDAELTAFFDKYKEREASPELAYNTTELPSATPGFKIPRKIDLQTIEANYNNYLAKAEEKVTDEEIATYYEANKDPMFIKVDTGIMEDAAATKDANPTGTAPATPEDKPTAEPPAAAKDAAAPEAKKTEEAPPSEPQTEEPKTEEPKTEEPKTEEPKTEEPKTEEPKTEGDAPKSGAPKGEEQADEGKQSALPNKAANRVFRLAAFEEPATSETSAAAAPADAAKDAEAPSSTPAEPTPPPAPPAAPEPPPASGNESSSPAASTPAAPAAPAATPAPEKKPVVFQPLDEVKDVIRRKLAEDKVSEELAKLTGDIRDQLETDFQKWFSERLTALDEKKEPPAPPKSLTDLAPLAEKNGLTAGTTGPVSVLQLRDLPIGKSSVVETGRSLLAQLFGTKEAELHEPIVAVDIDGNRYVIVPTSDTPGKVPTLAEVRDEVVKAWKQQEAAKLAEKAAEEMAKKAQEAKSPLPQFFADQPAIKVVRTDPFSELTGGDVGFANGRMQPTPFRLSQPDGIVAPGPDFMKKVFQLKDGEVGVVMNHDHSIAYVVRLVEHQMPLNELRSAYLSEVNTWPGIINMTLGHRQDALNTVLSDLVTESKLKWEREADKVEQGDSTDAGT